VTKATHGNKSIFLGIKHVRVWRPDRVHVGSWVRVSRARGAVLRWSEAKVVFEELATQGRGELGRHILFPVHRRLCSVTGTKKRAFQGYMPRPGKARDVPIIVLSSTTSAISLVGNRRFSPHQVKNEAHAKTDLS
jgi:hypothetical protein